MRSGKITTVLLLTGIAGVLGLAPVLTKAAQERMHTEEMITEYTQEKQKFFLSHGYGEEEPGTQPQFIETTEPETAPAQTDPGPKPYPETWDLTGGTIEKMQYGRYSGEYYFDLDRAGQVQNKTSVSNAALYAESQLLPEFRISMDGTPQVLIMHTHTTETFEPFERDAYDAEFNYRTTDCTKNMVMVGDAIAAQLEAVGIGVIHNATIHDYPSYTGSYARSAETVKAILEEYPSIKVVLDIHRDAIGGNGIIKQPTAEIGGRKASQVMIISGCDDGTMGMPDYMQNFRFAALLQQQMETDYPGLTRPILFDYRKYNQDLTTGSLLIEVGSHGNTLEQSQYAGELIGSSLARVLMGLQEET